MRGESSLSSLDLGKQRRLWFDFEVLKREKERRQAMLMLSAGGVGDGTTRGQYLYRAPQRVIGVWVPSQHGELIIVGCSSDLHVTNERHITATGQ